MKKLHRRLAAAVALAAVGVVTAVPSAFGAAGTNPTASCVGSGSSSVAPGQALNPFAVPGERAQISKDVQAMAAAAGTTPGQLVAGAAQVHGTAVECFPGGPPQATVQICDSRGGCLGGPLYVAQSQRPGRTEALEAAGLVEQAMSEENVEIVRRLAEAVQRGVEHDDPGIFFRTGLLADDAEWVLVALAGHPPRIPVLSPGPRVEALAVLASGGQSSDA